MKRSEGRRRKRRTHLVGAKMGRKNGRKKKKKNGGTAQMLHPQQGARVTGTGVELAEVGAGEAATAGMATAVVAAEVSVSD